MLHLLLGHRANVHARNAEGQTPLLIAAITSYKRRDGALGQFFGLPRREQNLTPEAVVPLLSHLLRAGAEANVKDINGWTPLHALCVAGNLKAVNLLLETGQVDVNARDAKSVTPLLAAVRSLVDSRAGQITETDHPRWAICKALLEHGAQLDVVESCGHTALHLLALWPEGYDIAVWLIQQAPDLALTLRNGKGETMLHTAVEAGNVKLVQYLLNRGADKTLRSDRGETALQIALRQRLLLDHPLGAHDEAIDEGSISSVMWPPSAISPGVVGQMLDLSFMLNQQGYPTWYDRANLKEGKGNPSPLSGGAHRRAHWTERSGLLASHQSNITSEVIIWTLLESGLSEVECTARDRFGVSTLHLAAALGAHTLWKGKHGWSTTAPLLGDAGDLTPFSVTVSLYLVDHITTHYKSQLPVDAVDERGDTALHKLVALARCVPPMTGEHASLDGPDAAAGGGALSNEAGPALRALADRAHSMANQLIQRHRDKRPSCEEEESARRKLGQEERPAGVALSWADVVAGVLLEAGASLSVRNRRGETALHVACRMGLASVIERCLRASVADRGCPSGTTVHQGGDADVSAAPGARAVEVVNGNGDAALHALLRNCRRLAMGLASPRAANAQLRRLVESALAAGADPARVGGFGQTALHIACQADLVPIVKLLAKRPGVDVNAQEAGTGVTPLMVAVRNNHPELAALVLLRHGADPSLRDYYGRSAEELAGAHAWATIWRRFTAPEDTSDSEQEEETGPAHVAMQWNLEMRSRASFAAGLGDAVAPTKPQTIFAVTCSTDFVTTSITREVKAIEQLQRSKCHQARLRERRADPGDAEVWRASNMHWD